VILRCATYARISTDKQERSSIADQQRKCREYAERHDWTILPEHSYQDEGISGAGADRPGLAELLEAAFARPHPFDIILVDDTSRLTRNLADAVRLFEKLSFAGVRVVAVSQGLDSSNEQADVLMTVHGLVDSLYVKELAKKTHRALEGRALKGLHTGGRCFGYRSVKGDDGVRLEVYETEAATVRRIFEMAAAGASYRVIATTLNSESVAAPRPHARKGYATWCPTAIREMLRRELYIGRVVWNKSRWVKAPGTNRRLRRQRPEPEWRTAVRPELRIVSDELWLAVAERLELVKRLYGTQKRPGLLSRAVSSPYLLSGFLRCGVCGANLVIVTGRSGRGQYPKYGCPQNYYRGACSNNLRERQDWLEAELLNDLQQEVLKPEAVEFAVQEFDRQLRAALGNLSDDLAAMRERKQQVEAELGRLTEAVAAAGHSPALLRSIAQREEELRVITERLLSEGPGSVEWRIEEIRQFVASRMADLQRLLRERDDVQRARLELAKHIGQGIRMTPRERAGVRYYAAEGEWNLLGGMQEWDRTRRPPDQRVRMVAGARFELATFGL
jgi:site-specific DNA recombinase